MSSTKHDWFGMILFLALPLASCRSAETSVREIDAVYHAQEAAWNRGDVEGFMRAGYWHSPRLTFYSGGNVTHGYDEMLQHYLASYKAGGKETGKLTFSDVEIVLLGNDHALLRGHWFVDFEKKEDQGGLFTLVLERRPEGWRILHDHTSLEAPSNKAVN